MYLTAPVLLDNTFSKYHYVFASEILIQDEALRDIELIVKNIKEINLSSENMITHICTSEFFHINVYPSKASRFAGSLTSFIPAVKSKAVRNRLIIQHLFEDDEMLSGRTIPLKLDDLKEFMMKLAEFNKAVGVRSDFMGLKWDEKKGWWHIPHFKDVFV
jgi:hypothetical protein